MSAEAIDVFESTLDVGLVFAVESQDLLAQRVARLAGLVPEQAAAGEHDKGQAAAALGHLDVDPAGVLVLDLPAGSPGLVMVVVADQVIGDAQQSRTEAAMSATAQAPIAVDPIGLVT